MWDDFKRQLKKQFNHEDAKNEARAKLRSLQQKEGNIWEYIKEFQELLSEIPSMRKQDVLFSFLDGLRGGVAKMELKWHSVQDLASVIDVAESLIEFKKGSCEFASATQT